MPIKILTIVGTRPEAIKMAPVIQKLRSETWCDCRVLATAQHRHLLDQVLQLFDIKPDRDLNIMRPSQALAELHARLLLELEQVLKLEKPSAVLVQGDTTTVMAAAQACFYHDIPVGHVEAGLRTGDMRNPFPEEMNRVVTGHLSCWHFAPTPSAKTNLLREGIGADRIFITGNTVIDALLDVANREMDFDLGIDPSKRLVLVTAHRRENFGEPFRQVCRAIRMLADRYSDVQFLYPVHPNPNVSSVAQELLSGHPRIVLTEPLEYAPFVWAMKQAHFILSDSGGVQEEAPALAKPVLVLRRETERPEAVEEGVVKLVGPEYDRIVHEVSRLLDDADAYQAMAKGVSPYGDGYAARRIAEILRAELVGEANPASGQFPLPASGS